MIECTKFKSFLNGSLQGFANLYFHEWGIELKGCSLHMKDGRRWVSLPCKEYKNDQGEIKYLQVIRFKENKEYMNFINQAKQSIDRFIEGKNAPKKIENDQ